MDKMIYINSSNMYEELRKGNFSENERIRKIRK